MIPVNQTEFYSKSYNGNDVQASLASLLELPLNEVPNFYKNTGSYSGWYKFITFIRSLGLEVVMVSGDTIVDCEHLGVLHTTIPGVSKTVVMKGTEIFHDPDPYNSLISLNCHTKYIIK